MSDRRSFVATMLGGAGGLALPVPHAGHGLVGSIARAADATGCCVNIQQYGGVGDGRSDNALAFQAALRALPEAGGTIVVPSAADDYVVASPVPVRKPCSIVGLGAAASLRSIASSVGVVFDIGATHHVTISDLRITGSGAGENAGPGSVLLISDSSECAVVRCAINNGITGNLAIIRSNRCSILDNVFAGVNPRGTSPDACDIRFEQGPQTGHRVLGNRCTSTNKTVGIGFYTLATDGGFVDCDVLSNEVDGSTGATGHGIILYHRNHAGGFSSFTIADNRISRINGIGIYVQSSTQVPSSRLRIADNYITDWCLQGTQGTLADAGIAVLGASDVAISGNSLRRDAAANQFAHGIRIRMSSSVVVTGNVVGAGDIRSGITLDSDTSGCIVASNDVTGGQSASTAGLWIAGSIHSVHDNLVRRCDIGINVLDATSIVLHDNVSESARRIGLLVQASARDIREANHQDAGSALPKRNESRP